MLGFLTKLFKSKKSRDIEEIEPYIAAINKYYQEYASLSDDELRAKTLEFKGRIRDYVADIVNEMEEIRQEIEKNRLGGDINELETLFTEFDKLKKQRNAAYEEILKDLIPEAFAVVKETCRRFVQNKQLVVTATDFDREIAQRKSNVIIEGDKAIWLNKWLVTGVPTEWDMIHYDVQLLGGVVLHSGKIAEMATGEGKTLVSTLPAYLNALTGEGVHIVTVNDYLAKRDCDWNGPIFEFHQLSVDCIDRHPPNSERRRKAYAADIVYGTNNEFGFDYLRDNMVTHPQHLVQRDLHYAIIDEIDSVLIDEARTPLIISGPVEHADESEFIEFKPRIERLIEKQREIVQSCLHKAKELISAKNEKEGGFYLFRAHRGLPKYKPLIKYLSEPGIKQIMLKTEAYYLQEGGKNMHIVDNELLFTIDEKHHSIELTDKGRQELTQMGEDPDLFVLPDVGTQVAEIENNKALSLSEKNRKKEELFQNYARKSQTLHSISQLLRAYTLFERDVEYIVEDGKVMIVDEHTGRVLPGRRYSDGLHQAIEAKENVKIEEATQTYATITLQNYFRMYHKLAGMTGTAETESTEFYQIYKLDVVVIPTNKPVIRIDHDDLVYKTKREKFNAIIEHIQQLSQAGRPVLVGTTSVETSELLSRMLQLRKIPHNVLNAKHHQKEAEIIAQAGQKGVVTIATNMAGRGTDIKLGPGVKELGGLAIIGSERHDSRRIDRQLRGRAGRQGDPGSSQFFVSLEDDLMRLFQSDRIAKVMDFLKVQEGEVIQHPLITKSITNAQKKVEENNFGIRKRLLEYDDVMNIQREAIYKRRRNALFGDRLKVDIDNMIYDVSLQLAERYHAISDAEGLRMECLRQLAFDPNILQSDIEKISVERLADHIYEQLKKAYQQKAEFISEQIAKGVNEIVNNFNVPPFQIIGINFTDGIRYIPVFLEIEKIQQTHGLEAFAMLERTVVLSIIDDKWKNHLRVMDELKQSVQTAVYEQKDPLIVYKFEAFEVFQNMLAETNLQILSSLMRSEIASEAAAQEEVVIERDDFSKLQTSHEEFPSLSSRIPKASSSNNGDSSTSAPSTSNTQRENLSRRERRELERQKAKKAIPK
ncbi:MAG: preprotein translocase subunit SecA [Bacteroidia bacterium]|nr:preprotein translocase subunit SecA [Bacteroidia bacterium]MDW8159336.1 preprotein translocase subunit SecA [Bacteroidia bacterium]